LAAPTFNSRERADIYRQLFMLNRSFDSIVQRLDELAQRRIFSGRDLEEMGGLTQEIQLDINILPLERLESAEQSDHALFGKFRMAMEKRLRGKS
jgi:hypothetical protein